MQNAQFKKTDTGVREHFELPGITAVTVTYILSVMDMIFTLQLGGATVEGNPFGILLLMNPSILLCYKLIIVPFCLLVLLLKRNYRIAGMAMRILPVLFITLTAYHAFLTGMQHYIIYWQ